MRSVIDKLGVLLNQERVRVYSWTIVAVCILGTIACETGPGVLDRFGNPKGADFITFYAASAVALSDGPAYCYTNRVIRTETKIQGGNSFHTTWDYPPTYLLLMLPLSRLPYLLALLLWVAVTFVAFALVVRKIAPHPLTTCAILAFPGTYQNAIGGQNGFLTASLLGGGFLLLGSHPFLGGCVLGIMIIKPQLAWLAVIALVAGRQWRAFAGAAFSAAVVAGISLAAFGPETWNAFYNNLPRHAAMLSGGAFPLEKISTVFGSARLLGLDPRASMVIHSVIGLPAVLAVGWIWSRKAPLGLQASSIAIGTCLAYPYLFDYDLTILGPAVAYLAWSGSRAGWLRGEKLVLLGVWLSPIVGPLCASWTHVQLVPLLLWAAMALIILRVRRADRSGQDIDCKAASTCN